MKKYLCLIYIFFTTLSSIAQNAISETSKNKSEIEILKQIKDTTRVNHLLILANHQEDESEQKLQYVQQALQVSEQINWDKGLGKCHFILGLYYLFNSDRDKTIEHLLNATKYSDDPSVLIHSFGCISNIYSWENNHKLALEYANKGMEIAKQNKSYLTKSDAWIYLGDVYRYQNNMPKAKYAYAKALVNLNGATSSKKSLSKLAIYVYLNNGSIENPLAAFNFAKETKSLYDNADPEQKQIVAISLLKIAQAYTASAEKEKIKQVELHAKEKERKIYIIGISLLIVVIALLFWQNYSRKKAYQKLEKANLELEKANDMRSRFFGILNHDLRRPVAGLINYLQLKTLAPEIIDPKEAILFEQKTIETAKQLLENMENLLFWCKDQMQSFTPEFRPVLISKLFDDTKAFFSYEEKVKIFFETPYDLKIKTDENYVKTIMRNLTSNAIQASESIENGVIKWESYQEDGKFILSITNNGPMLPQDKIAILYNKKSDNSLNNGLGLKIVRDLAKTIGCKIEIYNKINTGVTFLLIFDQKD